MIDDYKYNLKQEREPYENPKKKNLDDAGISIMEETRLIKIRIPKILLLLSKDYITEMYKLQVIKLNPIILKLYIGKLLLILTGIILKLKYKIFN